MAEGVFKELVKQKGLENVIQCDSAGTGVYHKGILPDKRMQEIAMKNGFALTHTSRQLSGRDFVKYNYILAMDESNFDYIRAESFNANGHYMSEDQLHLYRMFDPQRGDSRIIEDPSYYKEISVFEEVYEIVKRSGINFLDFLTEKHNLTVQTNL